MRCKKRAWVIHLLLSSMFVVLATPRISVAEPWNYWAVKVTASSGVQHPDRALHQYDTDYAILTGNGSYITLDFEQEMGDVCLTWNIILYIRDPLGHNDIAISLSDGASYNKAADWMINNNVQTPYPRVNADMKGWACRNWDKRWRYIKIENKSNDSIALDAVHQNVTEDSPAYLQQAPPYPMDLCDCVPLLNDIGLVILTAILMLTGVIALKHRRKLFTG